MRISWKPALFVLLAGAIAACSVGGGGTSAPVTVGGGGSTSKSTAKGKVAVSLRIPPASATSSSARTAAALRRASGAHPKFISATAQGLDIQLFSPGTSTLQYDYPVDISGANTTAGTTCTDDTGDTGRTCSIALTIPVGTYDFTLTAYNAAPNGTNTPFAGASALDTGTAGSQSITSGGTTSISVTLGGTVASLKLSVPPSTDAYASNTFNVGVTALDADGNVIISGDPYSTAVTVNVANSIATGSATLSLNGGSAATGVTSTVSTDVITLSLPAEPVADAGDVVTVSATAGGSVSASATLTPIFVTASTQQVTIAAPPSYTLTAASSTDTVTVTEGTAGGSLLTVTPASTNSSCNPSALTIGALTANGPGAQTFTVATNTTDTSGACTYDISDGYTTIPFAITVTLGTGQASLGVTVPGSVFYATAFNVQQNVKNAQASPDPFFSAPITSPAVYVQRLSDNKLFAITDPNLQIPLGVAHDASDDVFVVNGDVGGGGGKVIEYPPTQIFPMPMSAATPIPSAPTFTYSSGLAQPDGIAVDQHNGYAYVSDYQNGTVTVFAPLSNTPYATLTVGSNPAGIALDSSGDIYVTYPAAQSVIEYNPVTTGGAQAATVLRTIGSSADYSTPSNVEIGADGTIYVFDSDIVASTPKLLEYAQTNANAPSGTFTSFHGTTYTDAFAVNGSGTIYTTAQDATSGLLTFYVGTIGTATPFGGTVNPGPAYPTPGGGTYTYVGSATF